MAETTCRPFRTFGLVHIFEVTPMTVILSSFLGLVSSSSEGNGFSHYEMYSTNFLRMPMSSAIWPTI